MEIRKKDDLYNFIKNNSMYKYSNEKDIRNKQFKISDYFNDNNCEELMNLAFCTNDENILKLNNIYSLILYSVFKVCLDKEIIITLEMLKYLLCCDDKYKELSNFKRRCIKEPIEQINKYTDLRIEKNTIYKTNVIQFSIHKEY